MQSPEIHRPTKNSAHVTDTSILKKIPLSHKIPQSQIQKWKYKAHSGFNHLQVSHNQFVQPMFMPYIEGQKMD